MMNKKGVDAVVATVLIIMITVAAVAIIWMTVIPMIKNTAEEGTTCFNAQKDLEIVREGYTCSSMNRTAKNNTVQVAKGTNAEVTSIQIQWISAGSTVNTTTVIAPSANGQAVYSINTTPVANVTAVKIAPIVTVGQATKTCEALPEVALPACA
jgi:hypothetical protein